MIQLPLQERIQEAVQLIRNSAYLVVFTGAGISTPSGIPDFRSDKTGLWQQYDPMQVASYTAFSKIPSLFFNWFRPLFMTAWTAKPNQAHFDLAELEKRLFVKGIITQNIDGLHQKAGSRKVYELHGTGLTFACCDCSLKHTSQEVYDQFLEGNDLPQCKRCGKILKPDVVLFEEPLPPRVWQAAEEEARRADTMLVIGSSLEVFPASTIPEMAVRHGCKLIINNLSPTPLDALADVLLQMDAEECLHSLAKQILTESNT